MNHHTQWRLEMVQEIASVYAANPKVAAASVAGSVGHGWADRYSDIEIDVYWHEPPTDDDRQQAIRQLNGQIIGYWPLEPVTAVTILHTLIEETLDLVEKHLPGMDMRRSREAIRRQRHPVDELPPG